MATADEESVYSLARVFFNAATKQSDDSEDILPQEDGEDMKLSVFGVFAGLFPDAVGENGAGAKNKRMRLHFNKIGYSMYGKEQSRRVPSLRAKPGNPGYGFRRARWRDTLENESDRERCQTVLAEAGLDQKRIAYILERVQEVRHEWDRVRRPSRPAGPGRPRRIDAEGRVKDKETGENGSHCRMEEANAEPRGNSPFTGDDKRDITDRQGPSGARREGREEMSDSATSRLDVLSRMALPAADNREDGKSAVLGSGGGRGKMMPPSPAMKRWRDDDIFSPSIYPRLTALKLTSPCNHPSPSPGQLAGFREYHSTPLLNRSSPSDGPKNGREQDPSLLLPPLALPQSASVNAQPKGGTEERSLAESTTAAKGVTKKILGARSIVSVGATIAPPSPSDSVLPRGCQAHTAMEASFSALEFLATAAAAQRVSSI